jgi:hypothetical protein
MGPTTSVPCQSRATGMNEPQSSRQIRPWLVQAKFSNRLRKNYGGTRERRWSARLGQARSVWLSGLSGPSGESHAIKQTRQTEQTK